MKVVVIVSAFWSVMPLCAQQQVVAHHNAFAYDGNTVPPVLRSCHYRTVRAR